MFLIILYLYNTFIIFFPYKLRLGYDWMQILKLNKNLQNTF